jgi:Acetyl-CoA carboxylase, carboxyltransferase component (subunits alpha and beta)
MSDFLLRVRGMRYLFFTGPDVMKIVTNQTVPTEELTFMEY